MNPSESDIQSEHRKREKKIHTTKSTVMALGRIQIQRERDCMYVSKIDHSYYFHRFMGFFPRTTNLSSENSMQFLLNRSSSQVCT